MAFLTITGNTRKNRTIKVDISWPDIPVGATSVMVSATSYITSGDSIYDSVNSNRLRIAGLGYTNSNVNISGSGAVSLQNYSLLCNISQTSTTQVLIDAYLAGVEYLGGDLAVSQYITIPASGTPGSGGGGSTPGTGGAHPTSIPNPVDISLNPDNAYFTMIATGGVNWDVLMAANLVSPVIPGFGAMTCVRGGTTQEIYVRPNSTQMNAIIDYWSNQNSTGKIVFNITTYAPGTNNKVWTLEHTPALSKMPDIVSLVSSSLVSTNAYFEYSTTGGSNWAVRSTGSIVAPAISGLGNAAVSKVGNNIRFTLTEAQMNSIKAYWDSQGKTSSISFNATTEAANLRLKTTRVNYDTPAAAHPIVGAATSTYNFKSASNTFTTSFTNGENWAFSGGVSLTSPVIAGFGTIAANIVDTNIYFKLTDAQINAILGYWNTQKRTTPLSLAFNTSAGVLTNKSHNLTVSIPALNNLYSISMFNAERGAISGSDTPVNLTATLVALDSSPWKQFGAWPTAIATRYSVGTSSIANVMSTADTSYMSRDYTATIAALSIDVSETYTAFEYIDVYKYDSIVRTVGILKNFLTLDKIDNNSGKVGINTGAPEKTLHVNGTLKVEDTISFGANAKQSMLDFFYPAGTIYETTSASLDTVAKMNAHFGGTWEEYGKGRVLVGVDSADDEFNEIGETGGSKEVALLENQMPSHTHTNPHYVVQTTAPGYSAWEGNVGGTGTSAYLATANTTATGGGQAHSNLQPYVVVYRYKRVS